MAAKSGRCHSASVSAATDLPMGRAEEGETVLAVEDEPEVLAAVVETLTDLDFASLLAQRRRGNANAT